MAKDAKTAVNDVSDFLNNYGCPLNEFIEQMAREHRTLQQNFTGLCLAWLAKCASPDYRTDGRNEYSQQIARKLLKGIDSFELKPPFI